MKRENVILVTVGPQHLVYKGNLLCTATTLGPLFLPPSTFRNLSGTFHLYHGPIFHNELLCQWWENPGPGEKVLALDPALDGDCPLRHYSK